MNELYFKNIQHYTIVIPLRKNKRTGINKAFFLLGQRKTNPNQTNV